MLYLGIDQHARQLTISLRDETGDVLQARQVSTRPEKIQAFFTKLTREVIASEATEHPNSAWVENQADWFVDQTTGGLTEDAPVQGLN